MITEMLKMGQDGISSFSNHGLHHLAFIVGFCLTFNDLDRAFGAMTDARTKTITKKITDQPRLPVNELHGALVTVWNADAAPVAFLFVDPDNFSFHLL